MRKLRDAVHRDIRLTDAEVAVLDTPQMQRLRGIRQLGAAYLVYPGAQHTRFEHCVGTCWMAARILGSIEAGGGRLDETQKAAVRLASLVHDVTHIPFGHTFEDERRLLERHDRSARRFELLFGGTELGRRLGASPAGRLALRLLEPGAALEPELACLRQIVSGTICADLLDYLRRDNYFCGLSYEFDERVFDYFRIVEGHSLALNLEQDGLFRHDALNEITNLLRIRYVLSERVYYHHAKIAAGVMISKAIERALALGLTEADLCTLSDDGLIEWLPRRFDKDPALVELVESFRSRRLFKRCYMLSRRIGDEAVSDAVARFHLNRDGERQQVERRIARQLGAPEHLVALYCAPEQMALKEADVPVRLPGGKIGRLSSLNREEIRLLQQRHRDLWRLYVFISPELGGSLARAGRVCEEVLGLPNELPAERRGL